MAAAEPRAAREGDKVSQLSEVRDPPFRTLPPPQTFAEGQRLIYGWLAAAAGMFCGLMAVVMVALLMWGGWSADVERTIVIIFGCTLGGYVAAMSAVIIGLLVGGPVGRFKGSAGRGGVSLEAESDAATGSIQTRTEHKQ